LRERLSESQEVFTDYK